MTRNSVDCPKCRTSMEEGFIKDEGYGTGRRASGWKERRKRLESYLR